MIVVSIKNHNALSAHYKKKEPEKGERGRTPHACSDNVAERRGNEREEWAVSLLRFPKLHDSFRFVANVLFRANKRWVGQGNAQ